jgi:hypothetical protein
LTINVILKWSSEKRGFAVVGRQIFLGGAKDFELSYGKHLLNL